MIICLDEIVSSRISHSKKGYPEMYFRFLLNKICNGHKKCIWRNYFFQKIENGIKVSANESIYLKIYIPNKIISIRNIRSIRKPLENMKP